MKLIVATILLWTLVGAMLYHGLAELEHRYALEASI